VLKINALNSGANFLSPAALSFYTHGAIKNWKIPESVNSSAIAVPPH
jgi:hypothetical protein